MTTSEIAQQLVEYCRRGEYIAAQNALYSDNAESWEPETKPDTVIRGHAGLAEKARHFSEAFIAHGGTVSDPVIAGGFFSCAITADVTDRKSGHRFTLEEIAVFEVKDGKIVREQFFYPPMG